MSWLFSRALVEAFSEDICSDGEPSALLSGNPIQQAFCAPDRMTAFSRPSRFGMTFAPLTDDHGAAVLTSFLAAFPARCSVTWPRSGMTAAGQCWELPTLEHRTSGTGSGLWPAPTASQARSEGMILQMRNLVDAGVLDRAEAEAMISGSLTPPRMEKWPTPTVCGNYNRKGASPTSGDGLATAVYQTPVARMWKDNGTNPSELERNSPTLAMQAGGSLNPTWVEWLMGWPLGWTDLKPLETDKSHSALQPHGGC